MERMWRKITHHMKIQTGEEHTEYYQDSGQNSITLFLAKAWFHKLQPSFSWLPSSLWLWSHTECLLITMSREKNWALHVRAGLQNCPKSLQTADNSLSLAVQAQVARKAAMAGEDIAKCWRGRGSLHCFQHLQESILVFEQIFNSSEDKAEA